MLGLIYDDTDNNNQTTVKLGRHINDKKSLDLFRNVIYVVDDCMPEFAKIRVRNLLRKNGGKSGNPDYNPNETSNSQALPDDLVPNLYVSQNRLYPFEQYSVVESVTPLWVENAVTNGFVHDLENYSPVLNQFLSGIVLLLLDLPDGDWDSITNEVKRFGGQYRDDVTEDLTHMICLEPRGAQYNQCIEQNIPVILPQWLDDCFRFKKRIDTKLYRFPDPIVYYETNPTPAKLYPYHDIEMISSGGDQNMVFEDEVIYFGHDLNIKEDFKNVLIEAIVRAGGTFAEQYSYQYVTIVILKDRGTRECRMAFKDTKLVASLWWLTNTLLRGYCNSPLCTLLDYPTPPGGLPGMNNNVIAIAGYGNVTRFYLRRLVTALGARYDPAVNSETTHLICGRMISEKYSKATSLPNVTILNHLWLEDCYQQWKVMDSESDSRYIFIPRQKPILDATAGHAHLLITELERWMDPSTMPEYSASRVAHHVEHKDNAQVDGSINIRKRRKAAIQATRILNDIVIPDANAYEKESSRKRRRDH